MLLHFTKMVFVFSSFSELWILRSTVELNSCNSKILLLLNFTTKMRRLLLKLHHEGDCNHYVGTVLVTFHRWYVFDHPPYFEKITSQLNRGFQVYNNWNMSPLSLIFANNLVVYRLFWSIANQSTNIVRLEF